MLDFLETIRTTGTASPRPALTHRRTRMFATMTRSAAVGPQLSLFEALSASLDSRFAPVPSRLAGPKMRAIVAEVCEKDWHGGALDEFALVNYGLGRATPCCGRDDGWFCRSYKHAPQPNAAAFAEWVATDAEQCLEECAWYRVTFAWAVAWVLDELAAARAKTSLAFAIDETGAIVAPDDYRPEDALRIGDVYDGMVLTRVHVEREPRTYMTHPTWYPKKVSQEGTFKGHRYNTIRFQLPVTAWIEGVPCAE